MTNENMKGQGSSDEVRAGIDSMTHEERLQTAQREAYLLQMHNAAEEQGIDEETVREILNSAWREPHEVDGTIFYSIGATIKGRKVSDGQGRLIIDGLPVSDEARKRFLDKYKRVIDAASKAIAFTKMNASRVRDERKKWAADKAWREQLEAEQKKSDEEDSARKNDHLVDDLL